MSYLKISTNEQAVTYDDWFIFTIDISFSGLYAPLRPVLLTTFIPNTIDYLLPSINPPLVAIKEEPVSNGTNITFDYGTIDNTGLTISFPLKCRFNLKADDTTTFILEAVLYINSTTEPTFKASSPPVSLEVEPYYILTMNTVVPNGTSAAAGGSIIYEVILDNTGDQWKLLKDIEMVFDLDSAPYLKLDPSFEIVGKDISRGRYKDTSADNITATLLPSGNGFTFTLPSYRGSTYRFYFRAIISSDAPVGTSISWAATWQINGEEQAEARDILRIVEPEYSASIATFGPLQIQPGNYAYYSNNSRNSGNQDLKDVIIEYELPSNNKLLGFRLSTGRFGISPINIPLEQEYLINYTTTSGETYPLASPGHEDGYYSASTSTTIDLQGIIPEDRDVQYVRWYIGDFPVGAVALARPALYAYANNDLQLGTEIFFHTKIYWTDADGTQASMTDNFSTPVSVLSELYLASHTVTPTTAVVPGNVLTFTTVISAQYSQLNNPIFMNRLSDKITLIQEEGALIDSFYMEYYDGLTGTTINSVDNRDEFPFPYAELIPNYRGTTDTLIRLSYRDERAYSFVQNSWLKISFRAVINIGAIGTFTNTSILGNVGERGSVSQATEVYTERIDEDIDDDGVQSEQLAMSLTLTLNIMEYNSLEITKSSKGINDESYSIWPNLATGVSGGSVNFRLALSNKGNLTLDTLELIDIIPHIGDTGVILVDEPRLSEFPIYQVMDTQITLMDRNNEPITPAPTITVYYSKSTDPVRFGSDGELIGTVDDWSTTLPDPITQIKAYKIITSERGIAPGETFIIETVNIIPLGVEPEQIAWNSFAVKAQYIDSNSTLHNLLPVEPQKAGVIVTNTPGTGTIVGRTWFDTNQNGIIGPEEKGLNDVGIMLYRLRNSETAVLIATTISTPNVAGDDGYFTFSDLEPGQYVLRVAPDTRYYISSPQRLDTPKGSMINPQTGFSPILTISADTTIGELFAGFINFRTPSFIQDINKSVHRTLQDCIHYQLLLSMKLDDTINLMTLPRNNPN